MKTSAMLEQRHQHKQASCYVQLMLCSSIFRLHVLSTPHATFVFVVQHRYTSCEKFTHDLNSIFITTLMLLLCEEARATCPPCVTLLRRDVTLAFAWSHSNCNAAQQLFDGQLSNAMIGGHQTGVHTEHSLAFKGYGDKVLSTVQIADSVRMQMSSKTCAGACHIARQCSN